MNKFLLLFLLTILLSACAPRVTAPPPQPPQSSTPSPQPQAPQPQAPQQPAPTPSTPTPPTTASGCNKTPPGAPLSSISVGGLERSFITYIPADYDSRKAYPLIVAFHGRTNSNTQVRDYFGLEAAMPESIILYPSGLKNGKSFTWANQGDNGNALRDYALFDELLRITEFYYCIAPSRVFVVGHSLGAYFANSVACARAGIVRAVASLAGGLQTFQCRAPVASLLFHNPNDNLVAISEGERARDIFVAADGVSRQGVGVSGVLAEFNCVWYSGNTPVVWCPHGFNTSYDGSYYPHTWPDKTAEAIAFFFSSLP
jgi:polyhydroxybutyrate depolymerase